MKLKQCHHLTQKSMNQWSLVTQHKEVILCHELEHEAEGLN